MAMPTIEERLALARRHVDAGHLIIVHQRQMVERHKAEGRDTKAAEELLAVLERTQKVFERDLAELEKNGGETFSACRCHGSAEKTEGQCFRRLIGAPKPRAMSRGFRKRRGGYERRPFSNRAYITFRHRPF